MLGEIVQLGIAEMRQDSQCFTEGGNKHLYQFVCLFAHKELLLVAYCSTKKWHATDGFADEIIEHVGRGCHDRCGARIAEVSFDADILAERRPTTDAHRQVCDF